MEQTKAADEISSAAVMAACMVRKGAKMDPLFVSEPWLLT